MHFEYSIWKLGSDWFLLISATFCVCHTRLPPFPENIFFPVVLPPHIFSPFPRLLSFPLPPSSLPVFLFFTVEITWKRKENNLRNPFRNFVLSSSFLGFPFLRKHCSQWKRKAFVRDNLIGLAVRHIKIIKFRSNCSRIVAARIWRINVTTEGCALEKRRNFQAIIISELFQLLKSFRKCNRSIQNSLLTSMKLTSTRKIFTNPNHNIILILISLTLWLLINAVWQEQ